MNAARALSGAGLDTDQVRLALHPIHPESVNLYPAGPLLRAIWAEGVKGMTLWRWVFIDPGVFEGSPVPLGRLTLHELVHLRQISELGWRRFLSNYLRDYLRGRLGGHGHQEAYRQIGLEREAREVTARLAPPSVSK